MEKPIQGMHGFERFQQVTSQAASSQVNFFGVRHLSPAASYHLIKFLDTHKPTHVLIEGPADANEILPHLAHEKLIPPVAILAYTNTVPVETVLYPYAEYSPEYQAILWAKKNNAEVEFIDLPCEVSLSIYAKNNKNTITAHEDETENEETETENEPDESDETDEIESDESDLTETESKDIFDAEDFGKFSNRLYDEIARRNGTSDYEDYWERFFEHNLSEGSFNKALMLQSAQMREILEPAEFDAKMLSSLRDVIRESYMKRKIEDAISQGAKPEKIVVITGAYHSQQMIEKTVAMTDEEMAALPKVSTSLTLMPYSFYRLSSRSGYGAGNKAPAYFNLMWQCMLDGKPEELPIKYLTELGRYIREKGGYCSTANIIEAARLANSLAAMKDGSQPTLSDIHSAVIACIGQGDDASVVNAFAWQDVGVKFGSVPEGVKQTPVQDDIRREIKKLKLEKYLTTVSQVLDLDLRENFKVKTKEAAFIDLNRSIFFNRLKLLGIQLAFEERNSQSEATWKETWRLQWSPEAEIQIVESSLKGETLELAAAFVLKERLENCENIQDAANLIADAYSCNLTASFTHALSTLQKFTADANNFVHTADAAAQTARVLFYGDIRKVDTAMLVPILRQLFLRAALILVECSSCDNKAAAEMLTGINIMHTISRENYELVDDDIWTKELQKLAARDDLNPKLSGIAFSIMLERNLISDDLCAQEISKRFSHGVPADLAGNWFEGVSMRNRYALLSRINIWKELNIYVDSLDDDEFKKCVVALRRSFSNFEPREKDSVAKLLVDLWGFENEDAAIMLQTELSEDESRVMDELNDFDFDF